jgi:hypothetical protein
LPAGFELCDGSPITTTGALLSGVKPDFRGRFPRGATSEAPGSLGGANEVSIPATTSQETALSVAQLPMHNHGIGSHSHSIESHLHTASVNDSGHVHDIKIKEGDGDTISQDSTNKPDGPYVDTAGQWQGGQTYWHATTTKDPSHLGTTGITVSVGNSGVLYTNPASGTTDIIGSGHGHSHGIPARQITAVPAYAAVHFIIRVK